MDLYFHHLVLSLINICKLNDIDGVDVGFFFITYVNYLYVNDRNRIKYSGRVSPFVLIPGLFLCEGYAKDNL